MKDRTKAVILLGAISYIAYCLFKEGDNSEYYYQEKTEEKTAEELQKDLDIAVEKEDYERAAVLRDKILAIK